MIKIVEETQVWNFFFFFWYDSGCGREQRLLSFFFIWKNNILFIFFNHHFRDLFSRLMTWHNLDHLLKIKGQDLENSMW